MDAARWKAVSERLDTLLDLAPDARARVLAGIRAEEPALADELERLLALERAASPLDTPLVAPLPGARPGAAVGPYRLERLLGEGGMGQVWLARRDDGLYRGRVALKLLRPGLADPGLRLRFTREREILARLEHAHIARLLDAGISADQQPYLALDYVDGEPVTDWCRRRNASIEDCLRLFLQVCDAVSHAHANLIVHRDLKPSNILVTALDEARLLDFGIAKLLDTAEPPERTRTGSRAFTLHYAAPEQIRGEAVTTRTDVYALGVVLYELVAGAQPYPLERPSDAQWEEAILHADPPRPSATLQRRAEGLAADAAQALRRRARKSAGDLDNIVTKALAKRPEQRYPSVEALALDLQRFLDGRPVLARPQGMAYRARKYVRRHRWPLATAAAVVLVAGAALGILAWQRVQAQREAERARTMRDLVVALFEQAEGAPDGRPLDVRRLLEAGVARGGAGLAAQPLAHAELLGLIARLRLSLGDHAAALALLRRQAALIEAAGDAPASLRLESANGRGRALALLGRPGECVDAMRPTQPLARETGRRLPAQAAEFHAQLGRCLGELGAIAEARATLRLALALQRERGARDAGVAEGLADLAALQAADGDGAGTAAALRDALAGLDGGAGRRHPAAIGILGSLCAAERAQGRTEAAERHCAEAAALAVGLRGAHHDATLEARRLLAGVRLDRGRPADAVALLRAVHAARLARSGPDDAGVARSRVDLAVALARQGDAGAAAGELRAATATLRAHGLDGARAGALTALAATLESSDAATGAAAAEEALAIVEAAAAPDAALRRLDAAAADGSAPAARAAAWRLAARVAALHCAGPQRERGRREAAWIAARLQAPEGDGVRREVARLLRICAGSGLARR